MELFTDENLDCSDETQDGVLALNLGEFKLLQICRKDEVESIKEANNKVAVLEWGLLLDHIIQEVKSSVEAQILLILSFGWLGILKFEELSL